MTEDKLKQGLHPDPLDPRTPPPDPERWAHRQRSAYESATMRRYREALMLFANSDVRESVLDDLSTYFKIDKEECVRRCLHWEEWSVEEWGARHRESREDLTDFYRTTASWAFDLLWYAYLQAEGQSYPVSVAIAECLPKTESSLPPRHLDFGSGVGVTSQLFQALGYEVHLADVSSSLLEFARFRLERRSASARFIDLTSETLEPGAYQVITAVDTLVHVPDLQVTCKALHKALRPGGLLFANFDVRPESQENAWHLYSDDLPLRWLLQRTGFEPEESLDGMVTMYRRVEPTGFSHELRGLRDMIALRSPLRPTVRSARHLIRKALARNGRNTSAAASRR